MKFIIAHLSANDMGAPVVLPIPHVFESHVDPNAKQTIQQLWLGLNDPRSPFVSRAEALEDCKIEKMEIHRSGGRHEYVLAYVKHTRYDLPQSRVFYFGCGGDEGGHGEGHGEIQVRLFEPTTAAAYQSNLRGSLTLMFTLIKPDVLELAEAAYILQDSMQREQDTCTCRWFCQNLCQLLAYNRMHRIQPVPVHWRLLHNLVNTVTRSFTQQEGVTMGFGTDFVRNGYFRKTPFIEDIFPIYRACLTATRRRLYEKAV